MEIIQNDEEIEQFQQEKQQEERTLIEKAIRDQEEKAKQTIAAEPSNAPVKLGQTIQEEPIEMQHIIEEEMRLAIQGYVFDVDIRNLRSGRDLLIISVTDYTDSLQIKMFSRGEEQKKNLKSYSLVCGSKHVVESKQITIHMNLS